MKLKKITMAELKSSNKFVEYNNFIKVAAHLSDYGYQCLWLTVDDNGADFIGVNFITSDIIKVQIKSRITISDKYENKDILMAFPRKENDFTKDWVIVPHDKIIYKYTTPENYELNKAKSSANVPNKIWDYIKQISIVEPFDI